MPITNRGLDLRTIADIVSALNGEPGTSITGGSVGFGGLFYAPPPSGGNDWANVQNAIDRANAFGGGIVWCNGNYLINSTLTARSRVALLAAPGSTTFKRTVAGDILGSTGQALDHFTVSGIIFDGTNTAWSAISLTGSDANGQVTNLLIRDCGFKNPSNTWMVQVNYTIVDPTTPASKNRKIRIEDCWDDGLGQTFTLENMILVNCQDVLIAGNRFINAPATLGAHLAIYGFNRNVRIIGNHFQDFLSARGMYIQQSDNVKVIGNDFRTTANGSCVTHFNAKDTLISDNDMLTGNSGYGVLVTDFTGTGFDGHTGPYSETHNVHIKGNRGDGMTAFAAVGCLNQQGQTDIYVDGNMVSPLRQLFFVNNVPSGNPALVKRLFIRGNHVVSHSAFSPNGCIDIIGNAGATNGGIQGVYIEDNLIPASGAGSGVDISIENLADDVVIQGNRLGSPAASSLLLAAAVTNAVVSDNVTVPSVPTTTALGANVTSATPTGNNYRGTLAVVMAGALAANTRIATVTFPQSPFGATLPRIRLINQTAGAGLANVNFYVLAQGTGQSFDIACDQALAAGTYTVAYDVVPAGLS